MAITATKISGNGNTFLAVDQCKAPQESWGASNIRALCHQYSVDGLLLLTQGISLPYAMRIYNCDGNEAEMCGNGLRCLAHFMERRGLGSTAFIEVSGEQYHISSSFPEATTELIVNSEASLVKFDIDGQSYSGTYIKIGVPHLVLFWEEISTAPVATLGRQLRYHHNLYPEGANINFVRWDSLQQNLQIRTYERGVEAETPACGTGAAAAGMIAQKHYKIEYPIRIIPSSGESLHLQVSSSTPYRLQLTGKVQFLGDYII